MSARYVPGCILLIGKRTVTGYDLLLRHKAVKVVRHLGVDCFWVAMVRNTHSGA